MEEPLVRVRNLKKWFPARKGFFTTLFSKELEWVRAVDGISFDIQEQEVLCLAGESGCGKTTTARVMLRLIEPTEGEMYFEGCNVFLLDRKEMRRLRRKLQIIFQDPYESLNPRMTVFDIVAEPLEVNKLTATDEEKKERVFKTLEDVELAPPKDFADRFPHALSGGQRQRVAIAKALVVNPRFVAADEPVSMLDISIRTEVLNLMLDLRKKYNLTYLYITHDLAQARYVGERIAIMYLGRIMEMGPMEEVITDPLNPYTKVLISNVPVPDPTLKRRRILIKKETPDPINIPPGCRFNPRCPYTESICLKEEPELRETTKNHYTACHLF